MSVNGKSCVIGISDSILADILRYVAVVAFKILLKLCQIIFRNARKEQLKNRMQYGELYHTNYYKEVKEKNRVYYEYYCLDRTEEVPTDYKEISFVCLRPDGCLELPTTLGTVCRKVAKTLGGFEGFHFHQLRHTYTSNLLANGAAPKDVQELLGHSDVSTTMNVYAHSTRDAKRKSVRLLDKVVGND